MKNYIFYTNEGHTVDDDYKSTNNCQILGWAEGEYPEDAFENLIDETLVSNFEEVICQEIVGEELYFGSKNSEDIYNNLK